METYSIWLMWRLEHQYYGKGICKGVELVPDEFSRMLIWKRGGIWKRLAGNVWGIVGVGAPRWDDEDNVKVNVNITVPFFYYCTEKEDIQEKLEVIPAGMKWGEEVIIEYRARQFFWEYILIGRGKRETGNLTLEEINGLLEFENTGETEIYGQRAFRIISKTAVGMKELYAYNIRLIEQRTLGKQILCREVGFPQPGVFKDVPEGFIRQVVYF